MTREDAKKFLSAKLECMERYTSTSTNGCDGECDACNLCYAQGNMGQQKEMLRVAIKTLEQEPKTGHWINVKVGKLFPSNDFKCSECGNILDFNGVNYGRGSANYCPNCGAKMESEGL